MAPDQRLKEELKHQWQQTTTSIKKQQILKFMVVCIVVMVGFSFGLWEIIAGYKCNDGSACDDYEVSTI